MNSFYSQPAATSQPMEASSSTFSFHSSPPQAPTPTDMDAVSLDRLSTHLERLLDPAFVPNRADTEIVLASGGSGAIVGAHSCILAARSSFFLQYFSSAPTTAAAGEKARLNLADMVPGGRHIGRDALMAVLGFLYTGRLKFPPQECLDDTCRHGACRPAIDVIVESTYAAFGFQIPALVSILQRRLSYIVDIAFYEDIIPIIRVASTCDLLHLLDKCIRKVAFSTLDDKFLEKELAGDIYNNIKKFRPCLTGDELDASIVDAEHEKRVRDIHKALDSGNVDLVAIILKRYGVILDEAIHYAATYCEPKVLRELLKLDHAANVNWKNSGGYTPLHMACMRLEPDIIVALLDKGASVLEQTRDRRDALTICKRLTSRHQKDVNRELTKGQEISKPYLCILPILEETKRTVTAQVSLEEAFARFSPLRDDTFFMELLDLECRVTLAKLIFPSEAQLAMRIAEADSIEEFAEAKLKDIDLNESLRWRFGERFNALTRTVELGRRYFPSCSDVLDKFLNEESALALPGNSTPQEDQVRMHFYELREKVRKAFYQDTASEVINSTGLATELWLLYKRGMLKLGTESSQAEGAADSTNAQAPPSGLSIQAPSASSASRQLESQSIDVAIDDDVGVGSKRKLKSPVWDKFKRVKTGDDWFAICMRCQQRLKACSKKGTSHLHRHIEICQSRQATKGLNQPTLKI